MWPEAGAEAGAAGWEKRPGAHEHSGLGWQDLLRAERAAWGSAGQTPRPPLEGAADNTDMTSSQEKRQRRPLFSPLRSKWNVSQTGGITGYAMGRDRS